MKDSYDGYGVGICELLYEGIDTGVGGGSKEKFSVVVYSTHDTDYCFNCEGGSNLFGCVGLRNKEYCIFNKQYSKDDYLNLREKIIHHMSEMPFTDKNGRIYKYGEFFPAELSPFAYNETIANEYYPLTKEKALGFGYQWKDPEEHERNITIQANNLPDHINDAEQTIVNEVIGCSTCSRAYRILKEELEFLKNQGLSLPRQCPDCRHRVRFQSRNPLKLWHRNCQCRGAGSENGIYQNTTSHFHKTEQCPNEFETTYAPDRPEIVYCESCYNNEVV